MGIADYVANTQANRVAPKDAFSHATNLIDTEEEISFEPHKIVEKHELLSNVGDDMTLRFYQTDAILLAWLQSMARRDKTFKPIYKTLYGGWRAELGLTRSKNGTERNLQANASSGFNPNTPTTSGYGSELRDIIEKQQQEDTNFIQNLRNSMNRKR